MEFWLTLIQEIGKQSQEARKCLQDNCTFVDTGIWIFEGDIEYLKDYDVRFEVLSEGAGPSLGSMTKKKLILLCKDIFDVEV